LQSYTVIERRIAAIAERADGALFFDHSCGSHASTPERCMEIVALRRKAEKDCSP